MKILTRLTCPSSRDPVFAPQIKKTKLQMKACCPESKNGRKGSIRRILLSGLFPIGKLSLVLSLFLIGAVPMHAQTLLSEVIIQANPSLDTYNVLRSYLGANNEIESPDLYSNNHPGGGRHITQIAGAGPQGQAAFEFILHTAGPDYDKDKGASGSARARCEIKGDGASPSTIMAYQNDIMRFEWYFKSDSSYSIAGNDIIMQLHHKVVGPVVRLHFHTNSGGVMEARYQKDGEGTSVLLGQVPFADVKGRWMRAEVVAKFSDGTSGYLKYKVWDVVSGALLINYLNSSIDMWTTGDWNRPKWGIYAPFTNPGKTQRVRFADFKIQKWSAIPSDGSPPAAPSGLSATTISDSQINLAWTDNSSNETGFKLDRKTGSGGTYAQIATPGANATSYNNTGLTASTNYYYRVRATNASGDSANSNEANATTQAGGGGATTTINDATTGTGLNQFEYVGTWNTSTGADKYLGDDHYSNTTNAYFQVDFSGTQISMTATKNAHHGIAAVSIDGGAEVDVDFYAATKSVTLVWTSPTLASGNHTLKVRVKGTKNSSSTGYVIVADRVDITSSGDTTPPTVSVTAPTGGATVSGTAVTVSATASDNVGVVGVQFKLDGANLGTEDTTSPFGITWNTTTATNGSHSLTAVARDAAGNSTTSSAVAVTVGNVPAAPTGLTATKVGYDTINLGWTDASSNETGFKVERKKGSGGTYTQIASPAAGATSYSDTAAGAGTTYYYRVRATNTYGDSLFSNEANATTDEITSGRQGHWKLDATSGTTATDSSGNANTGTLANGPTWVAGKIGNGLNFDGVDDLVNAGSGATLDNLAALTVCAWIKADTMGESGGRIVHKADGNAPTYGWQFKVQGTNQIGFQVAYSTSPFYLDRVSATNAITTAAWRHVMVTWTGSATATTVKFYVDGVETTYAVATNGVGTRVNDATSSLYIGNNAATTRTFDGVIDDLRVYNRVLTAAEIAAVYRAGL